jgi:hypothetical protein
VCREDAGSVCRAARDHVGLSGVSVPYGGFSECPWGHDMLLALSASAASPAAAEAWLRTLGRDERASLVALATQQQDAEALERLVADPDACAAVSDGALLELLQHVVSWGATLMRKEVCG